LSLLGAAMRSCRLWGSVATLAVVTKTNISAAEMNAISWPRILAWSSLRNPALGSVSTPGQSSSYMPFSQRKNMERWPDDCADVTDARACRDGYPDLESSMTALHINTQSGNPVTQIARKAAMVAN
jgi:hypothetical protein